MIDVEALPYDDSDDREIVRIAPPAPAPYLIGARQLSDELLAAIPPTGHMIKALEDRVTVEIYALAAELQFRRERYNTEHSVEIIPERGCGSVA